MPATAPFASSAAVPGRPHSRGCRGWLSRPLSASHAAIEVTAASLEAGHDAVRASADLLSAAERQRARRFAFERDRNRFIIARARLRQHLGNRLGLSPDRVELVYGSCGKPALAPDQAASGWRFNLSHCGDVAIFAFARGRDIGVDVEAVRALPDADAIAQRFFSPRESETYRGLDPRDKPLAFFSCWTRKEAFIKALGEGLRYPLDGFDVSLAPGEPARIDRVGTTAGTECGWMLYSFAPGPGWIGALVIRRLPGETACATAERIVMRSGLPH